MYNYKIQECCRDCNHVDFNDKYNAGICEIQSLDISAYKDDVYVFVNTFGICDKFDGGVKDE